MCVCECVCVLMGVVWCGVVSHLLYLGQREVGVGGWAPVSATPRSGRLVVFVVMGEVVVVGVVVIVSEEMVI